MLDYTVYKDLLRVRVTGIDRENEDGTSRQEIIKKHGSQASVVLHREPENPYDKNAIAVYLKYPYRNKSKESLVGYLPKAVSRKLAPVMDQGVALAGTQSVAYQRIFDDEGPEFRVYLIFGAPEQPGLISSLLQTTHELTPSLIGVKDYQNTISRCEAGQPVFFQADGEDTDRLSVYVEMEGGMLLWKKTQRRKIGELSPETGGFVAPHLNCGSQVAATIGKVFQYRRSLDSGVELRITIQPA